MIKHKIVTIAKGRPTTLSVICTKFFIDKVINLLPKLILCYKIFSIIINTILGGQTNWNESQKL